MAGQTLAFVGSLNRDAPYFQGARGVGLAVLSFDETTGELVPLNEIGGIDNPTYLSVDAVNGTLYATSEVFGWNEGTVSAYRIDPVTGALTYINKQPTLGSIAAHSSFDRTGRFLFVANYTLGGPNDQPGQAVAVFAIREDGGLTPPVSSVAHLGAGPIASRQEGPHPHCVLASPDNRFVAVADLGIDQVVTYSFDPATGRLSITAEPELTLPPGTGPRHFVFHPDGRHAYVIGELNQTITALTYESDGGTLWSLQTVPAIPAAFEGENHCADLHITPDGRFLYGSNRGHDSIVIHAVDPETGRLALVGFQQVGPTPRNFAIDPSGRFLLVAAQNGDSISVFAIDPDSGRLRDTGYGAAVGTPMCVKVARF